MLTLRPQSVIGGDCENRISKFGSVWLSRFCVRKRKYRLRSRVYEYSDRLESKIMAFKNGRVAVIIPAYNEELSIALVVNELRSLVLDDVRLIDEIVVCDNGSTDDTARYARLAGARVTHEFRLGYGYACRRALHLMRKRPVQKPDFVVFVDGDHSVKASELIPILDKLHQGHDLVVGTRENTGLQPGALSPHQRFGNRLASMLIRGIWKQNITDLGPFRGMRYNALLALDMQDRRYGWTVEMQVKAIQAGYRYAEVPVTTLRRIGKSKISGTVKGTIGAAVGIFGKVFQLYWQEAKFIESIKRSQQLRRFNQS